MSRNDEQIVPGLVLSASGEAAVDAALTDVLLDLSLALEEKTGLPVDMQHVLAALVLAARSGQISREDVPAATDPDTIQALKPLVQFVFRQHGGKVGQDD